MSQRLRSDVEKMLENHSSVISLSEDLTINLLLDLRDTANQILAEMQKKPISTYTPDELDGKLILG